MRAHHPTARVKRVTIFLKIFNRKIKVSLRLDYIPIVDISLSQVFENNVEKIISRSKARTELFMRLPVLGARKPEVSTVHILFVLNGGKTTD